MAIIQTDYGLTKPPPGCTLDFGHPINNGLLGCWLFNEKSGSRLTDYSGKGNHGVLSGFALNGATSNWVGSKNGGNLDFAATDIITVPDSRSLDVTNFSVSIWFKTTSTLGGYLISKTYAGAGGEWAVYMNTPSGGVRNIWLYTQTTGANWIQKGDNTGINHNDGLWHHCVCTRDTSNNMQIFIDNKSLTLSSQGSGTVTTITNTTALHFGHNTVAGNKWVGTLDVARYYNRIIGRSEITQLYNDPIIGFQSPTYYTPS